MVGLLIVVLIIAAALFGVSIFRDSDTPPEPEPTESVTDDPLLETDGNRGVVDTIRQTERVRNRLDETLDQTQQRIEELEQSLE